MTNSPSSLNLIQRAMQFDARLRLDAPPGFDEPLTVDVVGVRGMPPASGVDAERLGGDMAEIREGAPSLAVEFSHGRCREEKVLLPGNMEIETRNEFRTIKRRLLGAIHGTSLEAGYPTVILITSALPGEGKTFTALNLALTLADERDLHILLIDGDVINPSLSGYFATGMTREGLTELLNEKAQSSDVVYQCGGVPNLSVLFAGHADSRASELMASSRFPEMLAELNRTYRNLLVVIDCSPVSSPEPVALARHVSHALVVVAAQQSSRREVQDALDHIAACPQISLIFNKSPRWRKKKSYYHYGYGGERNQNGSHPAVGAS